MATLEGKRVLALGGAGFIGSHVVEQLLREPVAEIVVLDNFVRDTRRNLEAAVAAPRVRLVEGSVKNRDLLRELMQGADHVFHFAALWLFERVTPRTKQGFSAPDATWFRGESIDYINRLLRDRNALIYEFVEPGYVARVLDEHESGAVNHRLLIWSLLGLEWWCRCFLAGDIPQGAAALQARSAR